MRTALLLLGLAAEGLGSRSRVSKLLSALSKPASTPAIVLRLRNTAQLSREALFELSEQCRQAGSSALVVFGRLGEAEALAEEQQSARGGFPGPCPVLYEPLQPEPLPSLDELRSSKVHGLLLGVEQLAATEGLGCDSLAVVPRVQSIVGAADAAGTPPIVIVCSQRFDADDDVTFADGQLVLAQVDCRDTQAPVLARKLRARGFAGVVVDFDAEESAVEPRTVVGALLSKQSSAFGSYGLKMGYSNFMSDQYWLNRKFKEAKALNKRQDQPAE